LSNIWRRPSAERQRTCGSLANMVGFAPAGLETPNARSRWTARCAVAMSSTSSAPCRTWQMCFVPGLQSRSTLPHGTQEGVRPNTQEAVMIAMRGCSVARQPA
jgi:hypothetical protein